MTGEPRPLIAACLMAAAIGVIAVSVVAHDSPAKSAAANAVRPSPPQPGPPVPKPVEYSPPVADTIPRDGTWYIGKEIKRGTYRTTGSEICLWQRLEASVSGRLVVVAGDFRGGPQTVALGKNDVAFTTQGCPAWELVR